MMSKDEMKRLLVKRNYPEKLVDICLGAYENGQFDVRAITSKTSIYDDVTVSMIICFVRECEGNSK